MGRIRTNAFVMDGLYGNGNDHGHAANISKKVWLALFATKVGAGGKRAQSCGFRTFDAIA